MDFLNKAKDMIQDELKDDKKSEQPKKQGESGQKVLPPGNKAEGGGFSLPGGGDFDLKSAADQAGSLAGSHGDKDLFSGILGSIGQNKAKADKDDLDERGILESFKKFGEGSSGGEKADEKSLGGAAALQALKLFNSGGAKGQDDSQGGFLALAMSQASRLFDDKAKAGEVKEGTTKQGVVQQAAEIAMKLFFKSQAEKQGGGGLASLAGKFLK